MSDSEQSSVDSDERDESGESEINSRRNEEVFNKDNSLLTEIQEASNDTNQKIENLTSKVIHEASSESGDSQKLGGNSSGSQNLKQFNRRSGLNSRRYEAEKEITSSKDSELKK